jgi:hypothetical protein
MSICSSRVKGLTPSMEMSLNIPFYSSHLILHVPSICGFTSFSFPHLALDSLCILKRTLALKVLLLVSLSFFPPFSQGFPMSSSFLSVCSCFSDLLLVFILFSLTCRFAELPSIMHCLLLPVLWYKLGIVLHCVWDSSTPSFRKQLNHLGMLYQITNIIY